ncbi:putative phosphotyrosine protein phosphatase [Streptococcus suis 98HAH33]|nr:putative phosphotyrosine protein phosphatase [Streptococcus suis 98HAH33]
MQERGTQTFTCRVYLLFSYVTKGVSMKKIVFVCLGKYLS